MSQQYAQNPYSPTQSGPVPLSQPFYGASFGEAIKRFFKKYATFSGRASRSEYWWVFLFQNAVVLVLSVLTAMNVDSSGDPTGLGIVTTLLLLVYILGAFLPALALFVRRLHDGGFSGWLALLAFVPLVGWLAFPVFGLMPSKPEGARFDAGAQQQYAPYPPASPQA